jgi:hypothetical protein
MEIAERSDQQNSLSLHLNLLGGKQLAAFLRLYGRLNKRRCQFRFLKYQQTTHELA